MTNIPASLQLRRNSTVKRARLLRKTEPLGELGEVRAIGGEAGFDEAL